VSGAKKAVFFDLGGTLLIMKRDKIFHKVLAKEKRMVSLESVHSAYIKVESSWLSVYGNRAITPDETNEAYRQKDVRVFKELFPDATSEEAERVSLLARESWPQLEKTIPFEMYPDSEPLLKRLAGDGYSLGLVSNAPPDTAKVVEDLGLHQYIGTVVISGIVGFSKPHPEIFRIALRKAGVEPQETIHVGDVYDSDVVGARNAGIQGVLIDREWRQSGLDCPRISNLHEVYGLID
jgi:HAD superfamily hydrolase (TIGR01549 family)